jgi:hypothetical protein
VPRLSKLKLYLGGNKTVLMKFLPAQGRSTRVLFKDEDFSKAAPGLHEGEYWAGSQVRIGQNTGLEVMISYGKKYQSQSTLLFSVTDRIFFAF